MRPTWIPYARLAILLACGLAFSAAGCGGSNPEETDPLQPVTVVSWGGAYQEALFQEWINPSAESAGLEIRGRSYGGEYANIETMVDSRAVTWDLVQVETFFAAKAALEERLDPIRPAVPNDRITTPQVESALAGYAVPTIGWSYMLAWNEKTLRQIVDDAAATPEDWTDFWDTETYPGPRALRDVPQGNIEIALLATGMTPEEVRNSLYVAEDPIMVDKAFDKLQELKEAVEIVWWTTGDQVQRELERGSSSLVATWNGRYWLANQAPLTVSTKGVDVRKTYRDAILDYDWWVIPRGAPNAWGASKLLNAMYENTEGAIAFSRRTGYSSPIRGWEELIDQDDPLYDAMPTTEANQEQQLETDPRFWAKHFTSISERWSNWRGR